MPTVATIQDSTSHVYSRQICFVANSHFSMDLLHDCENWWIVCSSTENIGKRGTQSMVTRFQPNSSRIFRQTSDVTSASTGRVAEQPSSDSWDEDGKLGGGLATSHIPTAMLIWWWTTGSRVSMTMEPCDCDILDHRGIPVIAGVWLQFELLFLCTISALFWSPFI